ncbi:hypothetical protein P389DRAFT_29945 [Cystobasidium minutum MCA 4210]|uniref:uncharacterized protein n=1 Tax=Cystobasidium minutum MCA 4210 TaxID=1397322 RepID=UPI0034CFFC56|eukprot:jgi/Rhomi1/29945/CE29944_292
MLRASQVIMLFRIVLRTCHPAMPRPKTRMLETRFKDFLLQQDTRKRQSLVKEMWMCSYLLAETFTNETAAFLRKSLFSLYRFPTTLLVKLPFHSESR